MAPTDRLATARPGSDAGSGSGSGSGSDQDARRGPRRGGGSDRGGGAGRDPWGPVDGPTRGRWVERWWSLFAPTPGLWPRLADVALAAAVALVQIAGTMSYALDEPSPWSFDARATAVLLVGPVALLGRRRWPEATLAVAVLAAAGYAAGGWPRGPAGYPAVVLALVSAVMVGRRAWAWGALAVAWPAFVVLPSLVPDELEETRSLADRAGQLAWLPLVVVASELVRTRLERRAERAHARREEARRRASEERLRITRELHDVLAHNISLINVQSGVALHLLDDRPEQARPALAAINEASAEALGELRAVLDVLSRGVVDGGGDPGEGGVGGLGGGEDGVGGERAPRAPTAGLRDLDGLVRRARVAGLDVEVAVEGPARPVPAEVDLAAFRIVQEAVTNVVRHAGGGARAAVRLVYGPAELVVQVDDDGDGSAGGDPPRPPRSPGGGRGHSGPGPGTAGPRRSGTRGPAGDVHGDSRREAGRGITGMRERAHALGGTLAAGPRPGGGGFRIRARLPLPPPHPGGHTTAEVGG